MNVGYTGVFISRAYFPDVLALSSVLVGSIIRVSGENK